MFIPVSLPLQEDLNEWKIKIKIFYTSVLTYQLHVHMHRIC